MDLNRHAALNAERIRRREERRKRQGRRLAPDTGNAPVHEIAGRSWKWTTGDSKCWRHVAVHWPDVAEVMKFVPAERRMLCVQAGGNFGVWPWLLSKHFYTVHTFEPQPEIYECLEENVKGIGNIVLHKQGLSDRNTTGEIIAKGDNHGAQHIEFGRGSIKCITLDSMKLPALDLLDLDIEGAEPLVIQGAADTITKYKPVICIEHWKNRGGQYILRGRYPGPHVEDVLAKLGYKLVHRIAQDEVWLPT